MADQELLRLRNRRFSALQRAEIAEMQNSKHPRDRRSRFSALQRAEIAEICVPTSQPAARPFRFSALQRAEIAEMRLDGQADTVTGSFSALQRAEIAEMFHQQYYFSRMFGFQCSSTSRNC